MTGGTLADWTQRIAEAPVASAERLIGAGGLVVIAPHPDDEALGASGLLTGAARAARPVGLVALTDGEGSHRGSTLFDAERLATLRTGEQDAAMRELGCAAAERLRLRLPDGGARFDPRFGDAAQTVAAFCDRIGASAIAAPHPLDPHPDHHASAELALAVRRLRPGLRVLFYEVWSYRLPEEAPFDSDAMVPFRVPVDRAAKRAAIACHRSQLGKIVPDDPDGFTLPDWFLAVHDGDLERVSLAKAPGTVPPASHFTELYAGDGDPWHVRTSAYEAEKRRASLDILDGASFSSALEAGCGEGYLTRALVASGVAAQALGIDREPAIVARAARVEPDPAVSFEVGSLPDALPSGPFDLVVLSEILYFLDETALLRLGAALGERVTSTSTLLVVSYRGPTGTPLGGPSAADVFVAGLGSGARTISVRQTADYRIERLEWTQGPREGSAARA